MTGLYWRAPERMSSPLLIRQRCLPLPRVDYCSFILSGLEQPTDLGLHRWRAIDTPPRLPALCVDFHSLERLFPHGCAPHQY